VSVRIECRDWVMSIVFDRPDKKNAITAAMYQSIADALGAAAGSRDVRAVLLRGNAECFTAGNDLEDFLKNPPHAEDTPVFRFLQALTTFEKPLLAAPCGVAVGVGVTMLLHCDLVYAGDNARLSLPFVQLGLCPEAASSLLLPALAGHQRATEKLLLGEPFGADEARELRLVNRVLPAAEAIGFAHAQAARIAALPPQAVRTTKRLLRQAWRDPIAQQMNAENAAFRQLLTSPEAREAFTAFLEKRKPDFSRFA